MAALSGKKHSAHKIRDYTSNYVTIETAERVDLNFTGISRSAGKKYLPVRISTTHFERSPVPSSSSKMSGKKYPVSNNPKSLPKSAIRETLETGPTAIEKLRSVGTRYLPVRISTAGFEDPVGPVSNRKTIGLSAQKPIRNIHKLFESPKKTVRKRLDNLYDYSKPKESFNPTISRTQTMSAKKVAPKIAVTSVKKIDPKTPQIKNGLTKNSQNSRQSRLLPPGTIADSFLKGRKSLALKNSVHKSVNKRHTLAVKKLQINRPSDVAEESLQPLEASYISSDDARNLSLQNCTAGKSVDGLKKIESNDLLEIDEESSSSNNHQNDTEKLIYCCKCSMIINSSTPARNEAELADADIQILINSKEIAEKDSIPNTDKTEDVYQRPTVIVMKKELTPQSSPSKSDELVRIPAEDGSYSEILSLQPSVDSCEVDQSLLFKITEKACARLENAEELNVDETTSDFILEIINASKKILLAHQRCLTDSISQYEKNLTSIKMMLENVNEQLDKQKNLESSIKSKGCNDLNNEELSLLRNNFKTSMTKDFASGPEINRSKETERKSNRKSLNGGFPAEGEEKNLPKNVLTESNQDDNNKITENDENQPPQRRRSARLAMKNKHAAEVSTPATEKNEESEVPPVKSQACTPSMNTPARTGKWGRRSERPLREYMVLKSAMKFLNTPDARRYRIGSDEKVQVRDSLDKTDQVIVSDKLLKELHDLYSTP